MNMRTNNAFIFTLLIAWLTALPIGGASADQQGMGMGMGMGGGRMEGTAQHRDSDDCGGYGMGRGMRGGMQSGMGMGMGMGGGMMGGMGYGMGMGQGMGYMSMLDLSDEQADKISQMQRDLHKKMRGMMVQIWDEQDKLYDLYGAEKPDPAAIGKVYGKMFDIKRQMIEAKISAGNQMEAVMTDEQREKMQRLRRDMMGSGMGMMGDQ